MQELTLTEVFCTRLLHDLLSPIGALQLSVDSWKQMPNEACASLIESSMNSVVTSLDLLRKTYGYTASNLDEKQLQSIAKENFGNQIQFTSPISPFWCTHILRLLVWLRYKLLATSQVEIKCNADELIININGIYLNEEEIALTEKQHIAPNAYLIYLIMLLKHLGHNISLEILGSKPNHQFIFRKLSF